MRPTGARAALPGKETRVQRGHLSLQETQARPGQQGGGACMFSGAARTSWTELLTRAPPCTHLLDYLFRVVEN